MDVFKKIMTAEDGVAWVTGASGGIGRATVLRLARDGWTVHATARGEDDLKELAAEAPEGRVIPAPGDVTDLDRMREIVAEIETDRPLALALLNAGVYTPMRANDFDADTAAKMWRVNLEGVSNCTDPVLKAMIARGTGHLAITASVAGYRGLPDAAVYSGTKAALIAYCEALAMDLPDLGVRISVVNPGFVETEATSVNEFDMPFLMQPEDAAERIVKGLGKPGFEIAFPTRFELILKTFGLLPNRAYIAAVRKATGWNGKDRRDG
ncbi:SDR family NAD(P)-dependent oxidoreductase [Roseobacter sp. HKCCA0434]|uniref:SDR family NAD(P)-dependent oxidoreductase n=1 Tax=Roseobacter sp. HKCCA0434 TaxID=3079297 RepID=UPI0029058A11|nr:SDR family NAD(P)-dependent oxidoreductase [Roseobacter sp. HKCCA0434]